MNTETSKNIQEHISAFHELMIVVLRRRAFFRFLERGLVHKATDAEIKGNAFLSYYMMDYVRGQLVDLRKFFETDPRSYKISFLVSYVAANDLKIEHKNLHQTWRKKFEDQVNKLIAHLDKDSKDLVKQIKKNDVDSFIDETNIFLNHLIRGLRNKGRLILEEALRDPKGDFLNIDQENEFKDFLRWECAPES